MFCVGRHVARDLSQCTAQALAPAGATTVSLAATPPIAADAAVASQNAVQSGPN